MRRALNDLDQACELLLRATRIPICCITTSLAVVRRLQAEVHYSPTKFINTKASLVSNDTDDVFLVFRGPNAISATEGFELESAVNTNHCQLHSLLKLHHLRWILRSCSGSCALTKVGCMLGNRGSSWSLLTVLDPTDPVKNSGSNVG